MDKFKMAYILPIIEGEVSKTQELLGGIPDECDTAVFQNHVSCLLDIIVHIRKETGLKG